MTLTILDNDPNKRQRVLTDLQTICPDPGLAVDLTGYNRKGSGRVYYGTRTDASFGSRLIAALVDSACRVEVRGEDASYVTSRNPQRKLYEWAGVTSTMTRSGLTIIQIVYDVSAACGGYFVLSPNNEQIDFPPHVILAHELSHARRNCLGLVDQSAADGGAIADENLYRESKSLPLRQTAGQFAHAGACRTPPPAPKPPGRVSSTKSGCFIATAAYGSPLEPEVAFLRSFRDDVLRKTRSGEEFFDRYWEHYYRVSPLIVGLMERDPRVKELVRWSIVTPIVEHLRLLLRFPDAPLEGLEEPWRSFLEEMRDSLEKWAGAAKISYDFDGVEFSRAVEEIAIVMRYVLRADGTREGYLRRLEEGGQIPLLASPEEHDVGAELLRSTGRSDAEICRIVARCSGGLAETGAPRLEAGFGTDHVLSMEQMPPEEWIYTVTVTNRTTTAFDKIVLFYDRKDRDGVVYLEESAVGPGESRVFLLGVGKTVKSYAFGCFVGDTKVAQLPAYGTGNMTPERASKENPTDRELFADSWSIDRIRVYTVAIMNNTGDVWEDLVIGYDHHDTPTGAVGDIAALAPNERPIRSGEFRVFRLGPCDNMRSYKVNIYVPGAELIEFPPANAPKDFPWTDGLMTAARASQFRPYDTEPCADFWQFDPPRNQG